MRGSRYTAAALLFAMALGLPSCAIPAWFAAQFAPPKKVEPLFEMPKGKTVLVFVDDILNPVNYEPIKVELTKQINAQLRALEVAGKAIPYNRLADVMASTPNFNALAVSEVGRRVGADLVLWVHVDEFRLRDQAAEEQLWRGYLEVSLRVVDVRKGRLWPKDREWGYTLPPVETPTTSQSSKTYAEELAKTLSGKAAIRVAQVFCEHEVPYEGGWPEKD